jgi:hypothetical protein
MPKITSKKPKGAPVPMTRKAMSSTTIPKVIITITSRAEKGTGKSVNLPISGHPKMIKIQTRSLMMRAAHSASALTARIVSVPYWPEPASFPLYSASTMPKMMVPITSSRSRIRSRFILAGARQ